MIRIAMVALVLAVVGGCADGRMLYGQQCMPDGSPVFWQYKNTQGNYDGAKASRENCYKK